MTSYLLKMEHHPGEELGGDLPSLSLMAKGVVLTVDTLEGTAGEEDYP